MKSWHLGHLRNDEAFFSLQNFSSENVTPRDHPLSYHLLAWFYCLHNFGSCCLKIFDISNIVAFKGFPGNCNNSSGFHQKCPWTLLSFSLYIVTCVKGKKTRDFGYWVTMDNLVKRMGKFHINFSLGWWVFSFLAPPSLLKKGKSRLVFRVGFGP